MSSISGITPVHPAFSSPAQQSNVFASSSVGSKTRSSSSRPYGLAVLIGRFEPLHAGHSLILNKALMVADKVLVLIGSSFLPRTIKNPFTYAERSFMIHEYCGQQGIEQSRVATAPLRNTIYSDEAWEKQVQDLVSKHQNEHFKTSPVRTCLVGHKKDESSYYLDRFPQFDFVSVEEFKLPGLDATNVRNLLFSHKESIALLHGIVPDSTYQLLKDFVRTEDYDRLVREYVADKAYKALWASAPFPPTFVTTDAIITKAGHALMVRRKDAPGEGLWALPGGFLDVNEDLFDSCLREIYEETSIDLPPAVLKGSVTKSEVFGHPKRSTRGRTITHAFLFSLDGRDSKTGLPRVRGDDDAAEARWIPFGELVKMSEYIFEDHLDILTNMVGL